MPSHTYTYRAVLASYIWALPDRPHNRSADRDARFLERHLLDPSRVSFLEKPIADVSEYEIGMFLASLRDRPALALVHAESARVLRMGDVPPSAPGVRPRLGPHPPHTSPSYRKPAISSLQGF